MSKSVLHSQRVSELLVEAKAPKSVGAPVKAAPKKRTGTKSTTIASNMGGLAVDTLKSVLSGNITPKQRAKGVAALAPHIEKAHPKQVVGAIRAAAAEAELGRKADAARKLANPPKPKTKKAAASTVSAPAAEPTPTTAAAPKTKSSKPRESKAARLARIDHETASKDPFLAGHMAKGYSASEARERESARLARASATSPQIQQLAHHFASVAAQAKGKERAIANATSHKGPVSKAISQLAHKAKRSIYSKLGIHEALEKDDKPIKPDPSVDPNKAPKAPKIKPSSTAPSQTAKTSLKGCDGGASIATTKPKNKVAPL